MGGRIRLGNAGAGCPKSIARTLPTCRRTAPWKAIIGTIAAACWTHAQVHVFDLQQSGAWWGGLFLECRAAAATSCERDACPWWWQGMSDAAFAIDGIASVAATC